jgi:hypothetical protein
VNRRGWTLAAIALALCACSRKEKLVPPEPVQANAAFREGDVLASNPPEVRVSKLLKIEPFPGGGLTFHVLSYKESFPTVAEAKQAYQQKKLHVFMWHAPIDGASYKPAAYTVLDNRPVTDEELQGYRTYVEMTRGGN